MDYEKLQSLLLRRFSLPKEQAVKKALRSFTLAEKAIFYVFVVIFVCSGIFLLWRVNSLFLVEIPTSGGTFLEGMVGNPRFINPVLAISEADKNLTQLVYSGLVRITPEGDVENDLAKEIAISDDRLVYVVHIRNGARFHDGKPVTADDVIFTIQKITDPIIKSPRIGSWDGVAVEKMDEMTISFTLKQAYTPFIYNLATGILPKHIWKNVSVEEFSFSQFNTLPVGSGPYKVVKVERNSGGIPNLYKLSPFEHHSSQPPFIENLVLLFFPSEDALISAYNSGLVKSIGGISPERLPDLKINSAQVISSPLPRVFAVFFNQSKSDVLKDKAVRQALDLTSPREAIVDSVLNKYAYVIDGPLPAGIYSWVEREYASSSQSRLEEATEILDKAGWKKNPDTGILEKKSGKSTITLSFSISTGDASELQAVASELATAWSELGAEVGILVHEAGDLNQNVIRPRNFDALLFGQVVGRNTDLYPFWHSSQRQDPGLNIALYANSKADTFLESARSAADFQVIEENYKSFTEAIREDLPAVFLYTPSFLYILPQEVRDVELGSLTVPQDRFLGIRNWYIETDKVWKIFANPSI